VVVSPLSGRDESCESESPVARPNTKSVPTAALCVGFVQVRVSSWWLSLFLVPSWSSNTPFYPSKCCEPGSVPQLLTLPLFSVWTHIWIHQGAWGCVKFHWIQKCDLIWSGCCWFLKRTGIKVFQYCNLIVVFLCKCSSTCYGTTIEVFSKIK